MAIHSRSADLLYSVNVYKGSRIQGVGGSIIVRAVMSVVEEFAVVVIYLTAASTLRRLAPEELGELANRS